MSGRPEDEKTIFRPKRPEPKPPQPKPDAAALPVGPTPPDKSNSQAAQPVAKAAGALPPKTAPSASGAAKSTSAKAAQRSKKSPPPKLTGSAPPGTSSVGWLPVTLAVCSLLFIVLGVIVVLQLVMQTTPTTPLQSVASVPEVAEQDLQVELVAVEDPQAEAEDEALIKAAIAPKVLSLSGDPVIIRQLANAPRQLLKLDQDSQVKAGAEIGVSSDLFRFKDGLDVPNIGIAAGAVGSQEDIASAEDLSSQPESEDKTAGSSVVVAAGPTEGTLREFAQEAKTKSGLAEFLIGLGFASERAKLADAAFAKFYGRSTLQKGDRLAARGAQLSGKDPQLNPVQVSLYSGGALVGTVAVDDLEAFAQSADPWAGQDIFRTELAPTQTRQEDRPRLLDAVYASALRNRIPVPVVGEAIMLLARSSDLEQKVQDGDTITLIYSPAPRDAKLGLGRVVYVGISRTTGNIDCYVFQAQAGAQFQCLTPGGESNVAQDAMVKPVNGVLVAQFGPGQKPGDAAQMNFGTDWTAPAGSPVVAAFDGTVVSVGDDPKFGLSIRLTHSDGRATLYGYLQKAQPGIVAGAAVKAGQTIGAVGTPSSSREPRLHFELRKNDVPVDPVAELQPSVGGGGVVDTFVHRIITIESANRCNARNPLSTAVGLGQFINSTWMSTINIHRPDLLAGRSRQQVLDLRLDCDISRSMTQAFTRDNAAVLRQAGRQVTPGNLYLAHFLGVGGAVKALGGDQNRLISGVFGQGHVQANPFEAGKSLAYLVAWAARKMGGAGPAPAAPATAAVNTASDSKSAAAGGGSANAPTQEVAMTRYDSNPAFTKLKTAVTSLLR